MRRRLFGLAALLACALMATYAMPAAAGVERMTGVEFERLEELTQWVYRNGATDAAPDCGAVCTDLWLAEHRPIPNQAASSELWGELTTLEEVGVAEEGVGLLPDIAVAMPFGPYLSAIFLGGAAFEVGWKIGGQIDKWLGIEVPPKPAEGNYYVEWVPAGETWPFFTYVETMAMPYSGFVVFDEGWGIVAQSEGAPEPCDEPVPTLPTGFTVLRWVWNECFMGYSNPILVPVTAYGLILKPESTFPHPVEEYTNQQVDAEKRAGE
jgi:hypothetical protein